MSYTVLTVLTQRCIQNALNESTRKKPALNLHVTNCGQQLTLLVTLLSPTSLALAKG